MSISKITNSHRHFVTGLIVAVVFASIGAYIIFGAHASTLAPVEKPFPSTVSYPNTCGSFHPNPPNRTTTIKLFAFDNPWCEDTSPNYPAGTVITFNAWVGGSTDGTNYPPVVIKTMAFNSANNSVQLVDDGGLGNTCFAWDYSYPSRGANFDKPAYVGAIKVKINSSSNWEFKIPFRAYDGGSCSSPGNEVAAGYVTPIEASHCQGAGCMSLPAPAGSGSGGSSPQSTGNAQGTGATGNTGTGGGKSSSGQSGGGGGSSATTQGDKQNSTPTSSTQGDQKQATNPEPSPFFDGKQYDPGSDKDSGIGGAARRAGRNLSKVLPLLAVGLLFVGSGVWWVLRRRGKLK